MNDMDSRTLTIIKSLTENNNHTEARIQIAKNLPALIRYELLFKNIQAIQELVGSIPYEVSAFRDRLTDEMLDIIEMNYGPEVRQKCYAAL